MCVCGCRKSNLDACTSLATQSALGESLIGTRRNAVTTECHVKFVKKCLKQSSELHRDPRTHTGHGGFSAAYVGRLLSDSVVYKSFIVFRVCVHTLVTANYIYICMLLGFIYLCRTWSNYISVY